MAKSKSERMKEYRRRKKEELGENWLKQERNRVKNYYTPTDLLTKKDKMKRREKNRKTSKTFYEKHKKCLAKETDDVVSNINTPSTSTAEDAISSTSIDDPVSSTSESTDNQQMIVKMPFNSLTSSFTKQRQTKRKPRSLQRTYKRQIDTLEDQNEILRKKLKSAQKRLQRFEAAKQKNPQTPKSKADSMLKRVGLKPGQAPEIRKQLIYAECINEEVKTTLSKNPKAKTSLQQIVCGRVIRKYRLNTHLQKMTNLDRRITLKKGILRSKAETIKRDVEKFFNRDDNSRVMPGKGDTVKSSAKSKKQKRILNDYIHNLHLKFQAESEYNISKAHFYRLRPKDITLVNFTSRSICLCAKHQNIGFKLRSLKNMTVLTCSSPDAFVDMFKDSPGDLDTMLGKITKEEIKYQVWKRVKLPNGKERMRIVEVVMVREDFIQTFKKEFVEFVGHTERVKQQYKSVKLMKENLPKNHALIQMDFSENYNCQSLEEIQSAYWNASMVTLHPTIIYYNQTYQDDAVLGHKCVVFVSEVLHHNASMVSAIISKTVVTARMLIPDLKMVHFWTDSPSSQYRNKTIFHLLNTFESCYDCKATWHYFESGHGKSACDGVGGTAKRNADMAVKQSKAVIQDANDFFAWASSSQSEIEYQMITAEDYLKSDSEIERIKSQLKPVKGTMSLHAVGTDTRIDTLLVRKTTCACDQCFGENGFNADSDCKWERVTLQKTNQIDETDIPPPKAHVDEEVDNQPDIQVDSFVVAKYDGLCYIGKVVEFDVSDNTYHISFMAQSKKALNKYNWPSAADKIWVEREDVLRTIQHPTATGKGGRFFTVPDDVRDFIEVSNNKLY